MSYVYRPPDSQLQTRRVAPLAISAPQFGLVLDRSDSMDSLRTEAIDGVNHLLSEQSADSLFSLTLFNDRVSLVHAAVPIRDVPALTRETYVPQGGTALNDGIGTTIQCVGRHASRLSPALVAIVTDGGENSSSKFTLSDIGQMVGYRQGVHNWAFVFLGPVSARYYAQSIGIPAENFVSFTASAAGLKTILDRLSKAAAAFSLGDRNYILRLKDK
jgi:hypothetical protein